jgi:hypothetical protein
VHWRQQLRRLLFAALRIFARWCAVQIAPAMIAANQL